MPRLFSGHGSTRYAVETACPLQAALAALAACLVLAPECGIGSQAQLQLVQTALKWLVTGGRRLIGVDALSRLGGMPVKGLHSMLLVQLRLAALCFQAQDVPAAAAEQAAAPELIVSWLAAAAGSLKLLGADSGTPFCTGVHAFGGTLSCRVCSAAAVSEALPASGWTADRDNSAALQHNMPYVQRGISESRCPGLWKPASL